MQFLEGTFEAAEGQVLTANPISHDLWSVLVRVDDFKLEEWTICVVTQRLISARRIGLWSEEN